MRAGASAGTIEHVYWEAIMVLFGSGVVLFWFLAFVFSSRAC